MSENKKSGAEVASSSLFLDSLNRASDDDICAITEEWEKKRSAERKSNIIRYILMGFFILVALISVISIVRTLAGYRKAENFYSDMYAYLDDGGASIASETARIPSLDSFGTVNGPKGSSSAVYNQLFLRMRTRILSLKEINPDIYGWVIVPGTENIDYPVLQGTDNDFYLNHEYTKGYMQAGSIYADYHCDREVERNFNTVLYGHNMQNDMMFSELIKFLDKDFFEKNEYVYLYTENGIYTYRIFSVFKADYRSGYVETGFPSEEDFITFAKDMKSKSMYERTGIEFDENSRIITLSTCTNGLKSDRYCVQGLLVDVYYQP
ncbi:MAG: class B sortase [Ruminococcaceae bacterium]|nr:class B sortase [Oscillospiraceae bacterium]